MSSAMRFDIMLAHGIHDMAVDMYPDASWCKRWLIGHVLGLGINRMIIRVTDRVVPFIPQAFSIFHTRS